MADFAATLRDGLTLAASSVAGDKSLDQRARDAAADVLLEADLGPAMQATVGLILAMEAAERTEQTKVDAANEALQAARKRRDEVAALTDRIRAALLEATDSTSGSVNDGIHTAYVSASAPGVVITDPSALPAEYLRYPPPEPDKAKLREALKAGATIPGAMLRNGAPVLKIRVNTRKDNAA